MNAIRRIKTFIKSKLKGCAAAVYNICIFWNIVLTLLSIALVCFCFWIGGFNFDQRGEMAVACTVISIVVATAANAVYLMSQD